MDMFRDYAERGDAFAAAVRRLPGGAARRRDHDHRRPGPARAGRAGRRTPRAEPPVSLLHRPATPYYLLLGASTLLLVLGLVMVFSASSVVAFAFIGLARWRSSASRRCGW